MLGQIACIGKAITAVALLPHLKVELLNELVQHVLGHRIKGFWVKAIMVAHLAALVVRLVQW